MTKLHEIWMHEYWNENASNDSFHFSVSVAEVESQRIGLSPLFYHFYPKMDSDALFDSIFSNIRQFNRKNCKRCLIFHCKNKNFYKFYAFTIGLSENREFRGKTKQNRLKLPTLTPFSQKNPLCKKPTLLSFFLFLWKISVSTNFMCLSLKMSSEMYQKVMSLDLRTALRRLWEGFQRIFLFIVK